MTYSDVWTQGLTTLRKALTSADAGSVLLQPIVDAVIPMLADYQNPLRQNLPRKPGSGQNWIINRRSVGTTPAEWVADTDTVTADNGSYAQFTFAYRTLLAKGQVTRKLRATGASYIDVLMEEIEGKMLEYKNYEDQALVTGISSATTPEGMQYLCTVNQQVATTTVAGGGPLTLAFMDEADDLNAGNTNMIVMTKRSRRELSALQVSQKNYPDKIEVRGGFRMQEYNGSPIYTSTNIPNTLTFSGTTEGAQTGGSASSIYFVDTNHLWVGELTPVTLMPLAKTTSQYDEFDIFCDEVLVLRNPLCISKLIGVWDGS